MLHPLERATRAGHPRVPLIVSLAVVCLALVVSGAYAGATIGLYRDDTGSSCSFNNSSGIVTAYVVVNPAAGGTRGVRFSAPIPSCFDATFVAETTPPFVVAVGSSQEGISVAPRDCQTQPYNVLSIVYFSNGGTTPCCEFPILADPATGILEAVDCGFAPQEITTKVAHFNADASCPCGLAGPPVPTNPTPQDASTGRPLNQALAWDVPDNAGVTYDVYFGTTVPPQLVASNQSAQAYNPGPLAPFTNYRWMIVARSSGTQFPGPLWSFTTGGGGAYAPSNPSPANNAFGVSQSAVLSWSVSPLQTQPLTFDVYFGPSSPPPLAGTNGASQSFNPGPLLAGTNYFWRIVAHDLGGGVNSGPIWTFTTSTSPDNPLIPSNPNPPNGDVTYSSPTLSWSSTGSSFAILISVSPSLSPLIHFGTSNVPHYSPGLLGSGLFYWQVIANGTVAGPLWFFITTGGSLPVAFKHFDARPSGGAVLLQWELSSDEMMRRIVLYRHDGTSSQSHIVLDDVPAEGVASFLDTSVEAGQTYHYELLVRTADGDEFRSPIATVSLPRLALMLHQNVPNPFNPQTTIAYDLPSASRVRLLVMDVSGRLVRTLVNETQSSGSRSVIWNGRDDQGNAVSSGVYFYVLDAGKERLTRKLVLLK